MYFTTYNRDMGEITMEPAYRGIEEETVTRLPSKAFDEFLKALDRPVPQTARDLIGMEPDWLCGSRPRVGPGPATCSTGPAAASRSSTSGCRFVRGTPRNTDIGRIT